VNTCDDGDPCTTADKCSESVCTPGTFICECRSDGDCNDNDACTSDSCEANVCVFTGSCPAQNPPNMAATGGAKVGEPVTVEVTAGDGSPAEGIVTVAGPDGSQQFALRNGQLVFTPDKPGVWTFSYTDADGNTVTKTVTGAAAEPPQPVERPPTTQQPPAQPAPVGFPWWIAILVAAILVVALLLVLRKRAH